MADVARHRRRREVEAAAAAQPPEWPALFCFALLLAALPLAFGTVDVFFQACATLLLGVALLFRPISPSTVGRGVWVLLAGVVVLAAVQFAPHTWFGPTLWRERLVSNFDFEFPRTHHPEPGRAVSALLAGVLAVLWFLWVRSLAAVRTNRAWLVWCILSAAALVAVWGFLTPARDGSEEILGYRFSNGWRGFGPMANRNHTATFLAMGAVAGVGWITRTILRKEWPLTSVGVALLGCALAGLLATQSRGGLLAFGAGMACFLVLALVKLPNRHVVGGVAAALLVLAALALAFGGKLLARFGSSASEASNLARTEVWQVAWTMWKDAPLWGHGPGTFPGLYQQYTEQLPPNLVVKHPESSWLKWLVEWGAIPVGLAVGWFAWIVPGHWRDSFARRHGYFLQAGCFAGGVVLLAHAMVDTTAHPWANAALSLACFAVALPPGRDDEEAARLLRREKPRGRWLISLGVLAVGGFWLLPMVPAGPKWQPLMLDRFLKEGDRGPVSTAQAVELLPWFQLNAYLHFSAGALLLEERPDEGGPWRKQFRQTLALHRGSWSLAMEQARLVSRSHAGGFAFSYWQKAIEMAYPHRSGDVMRQALMETRRLRGARAIWRSYMEENLRFALEYALELPPEQAKPLLALWWQERGVKTDAKFPDQELEAFFRLAPKAGEKTWLSQIDGRVPERSRQDRVWRAAAWLEFGEAARAWNLLASQLPPLPSGGVGASASSAQLAAKHHTTPGDLLVAQSLVLALERENNAQGALEAALPIAQSEQPPLWFMRKAAYLLYAAGRTPEAAAMLLREARLSSQ